MQECFELLIKLDNPSLEYEKWVKRGNDDIPVMLRQLIGVNMKDTQGFTSDVVPIYRHNQAVIDFFLSKVVFPRDAKEFPSKLGTSGWDLVEQKANFTTGFSGTNDNSDLLPLSITQSDPVNQLQTNAQVLGYLLQPENDRYICTQGADGQQCSAKEFLASLTRTAELKEVRVLLDVGAQVTLSCYELSNTLTAASDAGNDEPSIDQALVIIKTRYCSRRIFRRCGQLISSQSGWRG